MSFVVAIDGPAGTGKGTIAKLIAQELNLVNIDTGAMYRSITLEALRQGINSIEEKEKLIEIAKNIKIEMTNNNGEQEIFLNGEKVTERIRENDVNDLVSPVSVLPVVRNKLLEVQRNIAKGKNVIMEGRDIGTVVFPDADVKIYLDATAEERARRRVLQNQEKGIKCSFEEVLKGIKDRDKRDSTREIAPLKKAEDAIYVDSTNSSVEQVVEEIIEIIRRKKWKKY